MNFSLNTGSKLVVHVFGYAPIVYFDLYKNLIKWCMDRPNHQRSFYEPPTGLKGCLYDRFLEITFTTTSLFWLLLFFVTFMLIKKKSNLGVIVFSYAVCYVFGVLMFWLLIGIFTYG